jgi:hypothetical protein
MLLVPLDPTELPVVVPVVLELPMSLVPLEPWLAPLEEPMELLPELAPERLVPDVPDCPLAAEPEPMLLLDSELPEIGGDADEPEVPEL